MLLRTPATLPATAMLSSVAPERALVAAGAKAEAVAAVAATRMAETFIVVGYLLLLALEKIYVSSSLALDRRRPATARTHWEGGHAECVR